MEAPSIHLPDILLQCVMAAIEGPVALVDRDIFVAALCRGIGGFRFLSTKLGGSLTIRSYDKIVMLLQKGSWAK